jgi:hypothetical protein
MQKPITCFVGLDVHKDTIAVAVAEAGREEPRFVGTVAAQWGPLSKALRRVGRCEELRIVYEAGPDKRQAISANQLPAAGNPHPEEESDRQIKARGRVHTATSIAPLGANSPESLVGSFLQLPSPWSTPSDAENMSSPSWSCPHSRRCCSTQRLRIWNHATAFRRIRSSYARYWRLPLRWTGGRRGD